MRFLFRNGSNVTVSPIDGHRLREVAAGMEGMQNAALLLDRPDPIDFARTEEATAEELLDVIAAALSEQSVPIKRLVREVKFEYSIPDPEARANQRTQVAFSREVVLVDWDARHELLERMRRRLAIEGIVEVFEAAGTSAPVKLSAADKRLFLAELDAWLNEVGKPGLPEGIWELRNAVARDLGDATTAS